MGKVSGTITIHMKRGGMMTVEAEASCYGDSDGAGQQYDVVEDLTCYWPNKSGSKRKPREINPSFYDTDQAEEAMWALASDNYVSAKEEAADHAYEVWKENRYERMA